MTEQLYRVATEDLVPGDALVVDVPRDAPPNPRCLVARLACDESQCVLDAITVELRHLHGPVPAMTCPLCQVELRLEGYVRQQLMVLV